MIDRDPRLSASISETNLPMTGMPSRSRSPSYFSDEDDRRKKEQKKHALQMEIEKRKRALEENARLQYELRKLTEAADITQKVKCQILRREIFFSTFFVVEKLIGPLTNNVLYQLVRKQFTTSSVC